MTTPAIAPRRVLVVDDDPLVADSIRRMLQFDGHQVQIAGSAAEALQLFSAHSFDLVLLDYEMPRMNGFAVLQQVLAERRGPPDYGFVNISSLQSGFPPGFTDLLRQLAVQILPKPFAADDLLAVVGFVATRQQVATAAVPTSAQEDPGADS